MSKIDDILSQYKPPSQEQIDKWNEERRQRVDYEVGDWVETCNMLPGIVQEIDIEGDCLDIFYPHYAFKYPGQYNGHSHCSIDHCGVHKITYDYAAKLMAIGEEELNKLWDKMLKDLETKDEIDVWPWAQYVEDKYNEIYNKK